MTFSLQFFVGYSIMTLGKKLRKRGCERMDRPGEKIIERDIEKEMKTSYIDYAMSVIVQRALPDVRDRIKTSS